MTGSPRSAADNTRILRDVTLQAKPRVLGRAGAMGTEVLAQVVQFVPPPGGATPAQDALLAKSAALAEQSHLQHVAREAGFQEGLASATEADRRTGFDAGYIEGLEHGRRDAAQAEEQRMNAAASEAARRAERLDLLFSAFESQLGERLRTRLLESEEDIVALSHAAICRILGEQATQGIATQTIVRNAIEEWLALHPNQTGSIVVHVHPRDLIILQEDSPWHARLQVGHARGIAWQSDPQIELGGCVVVGECGRLDARLDTQLAALRELMLRKDHPTGPSLQGQVT